MMTQSSATQRSSEQAGAQFDTDRTYPGRWTITFSNPPINMFLPTTIVELGALTLLMGVILSRAVSLGPSMRRPIDVKDDRPIGPASERSTFWPRV
jgi:hypothetical protein